MLSNIYRPNHHKELSQQIQINQFLDLFTEHVDNLSRLGLPAFIFSDSNIDLLKVSNNSMQYLEISTCYGFLPIITKATRFQGSSFSAIDHIFSNVEKASFRTGVITDQLSDHMYTFCEIEHLAVPKKTTSRFIEKRIFNDESMQAFNSALLAQSWTKVVNSLTSDEAYNEFLCIFSQLYELYFPFVKKKINKTNSPRNSFMTSGLLISRARKLLLAKQCKFYPTNENIELYKNYRNLFNKILRKSKALYYSKRIEKCGNQSKKLWEVLREITNTKVIKSGIGEVEIEGRMVSEPTDIANEFKNYFSNIGKKVAGDIKPTTANFSDYLPPPCERSIFFTAVFESDIIDILESFAGKKSMDVNGFSVAFLKKISGAIASPLTIIANKSFESGTFPDAMKTSKTVPIFKKGGTLHDLQSYRPVSIVDSFSKIFEKLVEMRLMSFLMQTNFFYNEQFGFLSGRSTSHALVDVVDFVSRAINNEKYCVGVFLDVKKA